MKPSPDPEADRRPSFVSARLRAEPVTARHAEAMAKILNDPRVYRYLDDEPPSHQHLVEQYGYLECGRSPDEDEHWLTWILFAHAAVEPMGFVQATIREPDTVHIAYVLEPGSWHQGYGREAVAAMLQLVFTQYRVERAIAEMDTANEASMALVRGLGFVRIHTTQPDNTGQQACEPGSRRSPVAEHLYVLPRATWETRNTSV